MTTMADRIAIHINIDDVLGEFAFFDGQFEDMPELFDDIIQLILIPAAQWTFHSEGQPYGGWDPLSDTYANAKKAAGFTGPILHRTGALSDSLTSKTPTAGSVREISKDAMSYGTSVGHAAYHLADAGISKANVPRRDFIATTDETFEQVMSQTYDFVFGSGFYKGRDS